MDLKPHQRSYVLSIEEVRQLWRLSNAGPAVSGEASRKLIDLVPHILDALQAAHLGIGARDAEIDRLEKRHAEELRRLGARIPKWRCCVYNEVDDCPDFPPGLPNLTLMAYDADHKRVRFLGWHVDHWRDERDDRCHARITHWAPAMDAPEGT